MPGFIPGSRGSFMLDIVATAMVAVLPALVIAINLAKARSYVNHKRWMLTLSAVLLTAVLGFELEMRTLGWTHLAESSPYYDSLLPYVLGIHIIISTTTAVALTVTVAFALRRFSVPPAPNTYSVTHKKLGKFSALGLIATSVTGWIFYWMAFVAS